MNGEAFDPAATYTIATNDFTAKGGDTYGVFKTAGGWKDVGVSLEDALINYTTEELDGTITAEQYGEPAGRITIVDEPANYPGRLEDRLLVLQRRRVCLGQWHHERHQQGL